MSKAARDLKAWLREHGVKQAFLAERIGVDPSTMSKFMSGERMPSLERAVAISRATKNRVKVSDWAIPFQVAAE